MLVLYSPLAPASAVCDAHLAPVLARNDVAPNGGVHQLNSRHHISRPFRSHSPARSSHLCQSAASPGTGRTQSSASSSRAVKPRQLSTVQHGRSSFLASTAADLSGAPTVPMAPPAKTAFTGMFPLRSIVWVPFSDFAIGPFLTSPSIIRYAVSGQAPR